jgi:hypothetical protein
MTFSRTKRPAAVVGRRVSFELQSPVSIDGLKLLGIRIKGCRPKVLQRGEIAPHRGKGFSPVENNKSIEDNGRIIIHETVENDSLQPEGSMSEAGLKNEVMVAEKLVPSITHYLLGYGIYESLSFKGENIGFIVYGLEDSRDQRLCYILNESNLEALPNLSMQAGALLRKLHDDYKMFHQVPHSGNYSVVFNYSLRIVDLTSALDMRNSSPRAKVAMRYFDFAKSLRDFYLNLPARMRSPLIAAFVMGYFQSNKSLEIYRYAKHHQDFGRPIKLALRDSGVNVVKGEDCITDPLFENFGPFAELPRSFDVFKDLQERGPICRMFLSAFKDLEGIK